MLLNVAHRIACHWGVTGIIGRSRINRPRTAEFFIADWVQVYDRLGLPLWLIGSTKVGELLKSLGYSLQSNRKILEGAQHPERNEQFEHSC